MRLAYSEGAVADLIRLRQFIADKNPAAAARIAAELLSRLEHLRLFPQMGRAVASAPDPQAMRDMVFGMYVVRYTIHADTIVVLRIWHHYEDRERAE
ncbi:MAG: type II toxin-antitoxin system RelE/ParE family toxin [Gammaproteobacteria bacterium]